MQQFLKFILEWNSTCFGQFLCPSSGVFHCTHSNGICHTGLLTACEQDQNGTSWSCLQVVSTSWSCTQFVSKPVWHIPLLCVQWKTPDDGQRNCLKHVVSFQNKFEKLLHLLPLKALQLQRSCGLLNEFLPFAPVSDAVLPVCYFHPCYIALYIILPSIFRSS